MRHWLMKSEPDAFSIEDLAALPGGIDHWDGVRNYQARNFMRDAMRIGDPVFFYHSQCKQPGIVGLMEVCREAYPDFTAFDPQAQYYDPNSRPEQPRWLMVDVRYLRHLRRPISLAELKTHATGPLSDFKLLSKGNRLSVLPVTPEQWSFILSLE